MSRKRIVDEVDWPVMCNGDCGHLLRPPHAKFDDYDVATRQAVSISTLMCVPCSGYKRKDGPTGSRYIEPEEQRLARMRRDLDAMVADRRRRGVNPGGVLFPGEKEDFLDRQRPRPTADQPLDLVTDEAPLGYCANGHPFTKWIEGGHRRRWCQTCHDEAQAAISERREKAANGIDRSPSPEAPLGRCMQGHPYKGVHGKKYPRKYCGICKGRNNKVRDAARLRREARARAREESSNAAA